jgi:hypothetical protein
MGSHHDIMHQFVRQEINHHFSPFDNWVVTPVASSARYGRVFLADRQVTGRNEAKLVQVSFEKSVLPAMLAPLPTAERSPYGSVQARDRILLVPKDADTSTVPTDIKVMTMQAFSFAGNDLVWMKKPGRKNADTPAEAAS